MTKQQTAEQPSLGERLGDTVRTYPLASAAAVGALAALAGLGTYYRKRRIDARKLDNIYDEVIEDQIHAGAIAY